MKKYRAKWFQKQQEVIDFLNNNQTINVISIIYDNHDNVKTYCIWYYENDDSINISNDDNR